MKIVLFAAALLSVFADAVALQKKNKMSLQQLVQTVEDSQLVEVKSKASNFIDSIGDYAQSAGKIIAPLAEPLLMVLGGRERREREIMELMLNRAKLDIINGGVGGGCGCAAG